jgi:ribosomal protein S20
LGVVDKRTMINTLGLSTDPEGMLQRIEDEALEQVPEVLQARTLKRYVRQAEEAAERGDFDSAEELLAEVQFVAEQLQQIQEDKQLAKQQSAMAASGGGLPQPQGQSLPTMGTPTGTEGGRPPGPGGMM